jgi:hypothetical protein
MCFAPALHLILKRALLVRSMKQGEPGSPELATAFNIGLSAAARHTYAERLKRCGSFSAQGLLAAGLQDRRPTIWMGRSRFENKVSFLDAGMYPHRWKPCLWLMGVWKEVDRQRGSFENRGDDDVSG